MQTAGMSWKHAEVRVLKAGVIDELYLCRAEGDFDVSIRPFVPFYDD